jgi:hypothetical protein
MRSLRPEEEQKLASTVNTTVMTTILLMLKSSQTKMTAVATYLRVLQVSRLADRLRHLVLPMVSMAVELAWRRPGQMQQQPLGWRRAVKPSITRHRSRSLGR